MIYTLHAFNQRLMEPLNLAAEAGQMWLQPAAAFYPPARMAQASLEMVGRITRTYAKPEFGLDVEPEVLDEKPFCRLLRFANRHGSRDARTLFLVAPLSGHHATLLRDTVDALIEQDDVLITDWTDASQVPVGDGPFGLDDFVAYLLDFMDLAHADSGRAGYHAVAVCQPTVPLLAAVALQAQHGAAAKPQSLTLMSGPIDAGAAETEVTRLANRHTTNWFRRHVIHTVPISHPGAGRDVYPGYLQLAGFMAMNPDRHVEQHANLFYDRLMGEHHRAQKMTDFYDEYLSVLDMDAQFYLETIERVFQRRELASGRFRWRGELVDPGAVTDVPTLTVEGGRDDISAPGQTAAAHTLLSGLPDAQKAHHLEEGAGHYGTFAGRRFHTSILPKLRDWIATHG
jgi:poly(3-hydroxybutyrate) depolymerase